LFIVCTVCYRGSAGAVRRGLTITGPGPVWVRSLIHYRPFSNTDPPLLAELWRSCADRPLVQPLTAAMFEQLVLNKPYFDREGLWLAIEDEKPQGFVHAGFGPSEDESTLSTDLGVTSMLIVRPRDDQIDMAGELLRRSEDYLRNRGSKVLYAGAVHPLNPFYLGLYGGSELPGVLDSDRGMQRLLLAHNYREIDRTLVFQRTLTDFRAPVDRKQMQVRRRTQMAVVEEPPSKSWWEACTLGEFERVEFQLLDRELGKEIASATMRAIENTPANSGVRTSGLVDVHVDPALQHEGLATFLISEALKELSHQGIGLVEAQTMERNKAAIGLYEKLGFTRVDSGAVYRRE
jgi:ribosomal protein S18 acetylase RimI-like enzyme